MKTIFHRSLGRAIERIGDAQRRYRDFQSLNAMSDHELDDIGLTRGDVMTAFRTGRGPLRSF